MLGKLAIGFYLSEKNIGNTYGAAGSIIIILLWVYYSAMILYFGAAFTRHYAQYKGRRIFPNDYAVWTEQVERESSGSLQEQPVNIVKQEKPPPEITRMEKGEGT
jgi:membrane protein